MKITEIYSYPLKSGSALSSNKVNVVQSGIKNDRTFIVIDENNRAITGREYPVLTKIRANVLDKSLHLSFKCHEQLEIMLPDKLHDEVCFKLFRNKINGLLCSIESSNWLSKVLGINCRLVYLDDNYRSVESSRGGRIGDILSYADASPIHLISKASLRVINSLLNKLVTPLHFRPNIVVSGGIPFEEDNWKSVRIDDCEFEVQQKCRRCIFTTIDPTTARKDTDLEPLATLANFRKDRNEELTFGVYLVPRKMGNIHLNSIIKAESSGIL